MPKSQRNSYSNREAMCVSQDTKHVKVLEREKSTLWYSSYSTAPEILGNIQCHGDEHGAGYTSLGSRSGKFTFVTGHIQRGTCAHWLCRQGRSSGKGSLVQGGPPDSAWSMALLPYNWGEHASPELETWRWMGLLPLRHNNAPWIQGFNATAWWSITHTEKLLTFHSEVTHKPYAD